MSLSHGNDVSCGTGKDTLLGKKTDSAILGGCGILSMTFLKIKIYRVLDGLTNSRQLKWLLKVNFHIYFYMFHYYCFVYVCYSSHCVILFI